MKTNTINTWRRLLKLKLKIGLSNKEFKDYIKTGKLPKNYVFLQGALKNEKKYKT